MTKAARRKNRRLKRTVRKTLGTLFLVSALIIAAIPVDGLRAAGENGIMPLADYVAANTSIDHVTNIKDAHSVAGRQNDIPEINENTKIYTSQDKLIRFAYLHDRSGYGLLLLDTARGSFQRESLICQKM